MRMTTDRLIEEILDFMTILYRCHAGTTYAEDRAIYAKDLTMAMSWIVELRSGVDIKEIIDKISSPETDKYFTDYWRQGEWGAKEADALEALKVAIIAA